MCEFKRYREMILAGVVFAFFLLINCYKLTNASLWYDETIEYWYSKVMVGTVPFEKTTNMYQRIIATYQPPLYNVVMHFWLKISDTEWWFRFFGVIMGFVATAGIYKSVKRLSNFYLASFSVLFSSTVYWLAYYWQECSEYSLMLAALCWTVYFWICLFQEVSCKNIVLFTVFSVISVYSQYGAAFPVAGMALTALLAVMLKKDRKYIGIILGSYLSAFFFAAVPLYLFFIQKQMQKQKRGKVGFHAISFSEEFIKDCWNQLKIMVRWSFFPDYYSVIVPIFLIVFLVVVFVSLFAVKNRLIRWMVLFQVITYVIYYVAVKAGYYAYGDFANRYNLFFIPLLIILLFAVCFDSCKLILRRRSAFSGGGGIAIVFY